ncbi:MAG: protein-L-isoaspartate(D-aspartate) O-methyltransferase [Thermoguttaceae bacterium]
MTLIDFAHARRQMVQRQLRRRGIGDARVLAAMGRVPREQFLPPPFRDQAYADCALAIDCGQTISQPYMVALMTEALQLSGGEKVLEIGTGSGYQAAVLAELARQVVTIERYAELSARAAAVLDELGYRNVTLLTGDGTLGWPADAPYDRILVTAAAQRAPEPLLAQLAEGGILVVPVGSRSVQMLQAIRRLGDAFETVELSSCRFVPLVGAEGWPE